MPLPPIPSLSPGDLREATWDDLRPLFEELVQRALDGDAGFAAWLADWSRLDETVTEAAALATIAYTCDTADAAKEAAHLRFSGDILPQLEEWEVRLARRLVESGRVRPGMEVSLRQFRTAIEIFREENVPLLTEIENHSTRYQKITGGLTVLWEGEERTLPELQPYLQDPDRSVREWAFRLVCEAYAAVRDELAGIFDQLFALRVRVARNAGFDDVEAYSFRSKCRFDYAPEDCRRFHHAVEQVVVPAVDRLMARRRERLGVATLRPWDVGPDPEGRPALRPFREVDELIHIGHTVFRRVAPDFGAQFQTMINESLLDLGSRKGKAPGGYC